LIKVNGSPALGRMDYSVRRMGPSGDGRLNDSRAQDAGARLRLSDRLGNASSCPSDRYLRGVGFLEGDHALKIKRAVRFPYLDYSTPAQPKAACEEGMKINRQFAPQIYRRVVAITEDTDGSLDIDGHGNPNGASDWAIIDASGTPVETLKQCQAQIAGLK
jgi:hypothetical protein